MTSAFTFARSACAAGLAWLGCALAGPAAAQVVNIDASLSGCDATHCNGVFLSPGQVLGSIVNPTRLTLGAGTYVVTNGAGHPGANPAFTAWRVNNNGGNNWTWSFLIADDATRAVVMFGCCSTVPGNPPPLFPTQAQAAMQPFAQNYSASFTLAAPTTLDFLTEDYFPSDNAGGVALLISAAVPEPGTGALAVAGAMAVAAISRRRHLIAA